MKKRFDVIVIGAGSGLIISSEAASRGLKTAIIEPGPFGGTCLNRGCIPSKVLIHSADVADYINRSELFGIDARISEVRWKKIMDRISFVDREARGIEKANRQDRNITVYKAEARFLDSDTLQVGKDTITAPKLFVCAGARPLVPDIEGLEGTGYLTSREALRLKRRPKKLIIVGGGYIGTELAHFFGALGTKVTIIDRNKVLMKNEDLDVAKRLTEVYSRRFNVVLEADVKKVSKKDGVFTVSAQRKGNSLKFKGDALLIAAGRRPNTDTLDVDRAGIKTDEKGFIIADSYMRTNRKGVFAIGDIVGRQMFKHAANVEAKVAARNAFGGRVKMDYSVMPHAAFTSPQVAAVGKTERELQRAKVPYLKGVFDFFDSGYGKAIEDRDGFVKVLVHENSRKILGCHIVGSHASILIHEVILAMSAGLTADAILDSVHIHPALSEVVKGAFADL